MTGCGAGLTRCSVSRQHPNMRFSFYNKDFQNVCLDIGRARLSVSWWGWRFVLMRRRPMTVNLLWLNAAADDPYGCYRRIRFWEPPTP
jgi:hypothetical protein